MEAPRSTTVHDELYLCQLESMTYHRELRVAAAMDYCALEKLACPLWACTSASSLLISDAKTGKRGRSNNWIARYRQDQIDYERWSTVKEVREKQPEVLSSLEFMRAHGDFPSEHLNAQKKLSEWSGHILDRAYECAAMLLRGRNAFAGPDAVKASYLKVEKHFRNQESALRYFRFDERFIRKLGFEKLSRRRQVTKIAPIYNLTL